MRSIILIFALFTVMANRSSGQLIAFEDLSPKHQKQFDKAKQFYYDGNEEEASELLTELLDDAPGFAVTRCNAKT